MQRVCLDFPQLLQMPHSECDGDIAACDGCGAGSAVGLNDIAIDGEGAFA